MGMLRVLFWSFFVAILLFAVTSKGSEVSMAHQIHLLRPQFGSSGGHVPGLSCLSWRLGVETNNIIGWATVPEACQGYIGHYVLGSQYQKDSKFVADEAFVYAKTLNLTKHGNSLWVFDIDETSLSNLPYYAHHGFGYVYIYSTKIAASFSFSK